MKQTTTQWIDTQNDLRLCCSQLEGAEWIVLDTEFERVRTYYPRLCLLQLASKQGIWLLDPLCLLNLDALKPVLNKAGTVIIHAARQDLEVLDYALGILPATLFDTQVAAAFLGLGDQVGYAALVQQTQGIELEKSQTRTHWCQRPLSDAQLQYAADDVRYLGPLYLQLQEQLDQVGKLHWMKEEMNNIVAQRAWQLDPQSTAQRLLGRRSQLSQRSQNLFVMLAIWREEVAIRRNLPREWVLSNDILRQIAECNPQSTDQLLKLADFGSKMLDRYGKSILQITHSTTPGSENDPKPSLSDNRVLLKKLQKITARVAHEHSVSPGLLASKKTLLELLEGEKDCQLCHGWRQQLLGEQLKGIIAAQQQNHPTSV